MPSVSDWPKRCAKLSVRENLVLITLRMAKRYARTQSANWYAWLEITRIAQLSQPPRSVSDQLG